MNILSDSIEYNRAVTVFLSILNQMEFPFGPKSKGKLSQQPYPIQFERKRKYSLLSVTGNKDYTYLPTFWSCFKKIFQHYSNVLKKDHQHPNFVREKIISILVLFRK